jgi:archaellum biogenesis ATPase FlaH
MYEEGYTRQVLPFIDEKYFQDQTERNIFLGVRQFLEKFQTLPSKEAILLDINNTPTIAQDQYEEIVSYVGELEKEKEEKPNPEWLLSQTESWCQERAIHNAVLEAINILDDKSGKKSKGIIPKLLQDAIAVSFDNKVGHDYLEDAEARFDFYKLVEKRIPFHLDYFNKITKNGVPNKTLNIILAGTGVGKSLFMCDVAANYLANQNKNVLYITLEMAEERIAERIDANLMDLPLDELKDMPKVNFDARMTRINSRAKGGRLIIKEYATAQAHVGHFRHLMNELLLKKKFKPDVVFIDYLNICASSRVKIGNGGMYEYVKAIAEELRGFGVEFNVPVWSATQMNRAGFNNNDPDLTNTAESFGLPATADFMFALITDEQLASMNQLLVKILKNRYGDVNMRNVETGSSMNRFLIGVDKSKMKLYNLDEAAQENLNNDGAAASPRIPVLLNETENNERAPWEAPDDDSGTEEPKMKTAEPVFDIDIEPPFREAVEDAERRRGAIKAETAEYKPSGSMITKVVKTAGKRLNV